MNAQEQDMYAFAKDLLNSAGSILLSQPKHSEIKVWEKTCQMDLVTEHDLAIEQFLVAAITEHYPSHGILAEEGSKALTNTGSYTWVIDPIDGTVNYYRFHKDYAISLALYCDETPVFGFVYDVANDVMFTAVHGVGAMINGCCLPELPKCNDRLKHAVVAISLRTMREFSGMGMDVLEMLSRVQAHRYLGCASLELCKVANGEYDLFISSNVYEWDVAAARIYLEERGGVCLLYRQEYYASSDRLLVAAFHSQALWEEVIPYLPRTLRDKFFDRNLLGKIPLMGRGKSPRSNRNVTLIDYWNS